MSEINDIKDGFNAGYIIRKEKPQLYEQLNKATQNVELPFFQSFTEGGKELAKEHIKSLMAKDSISGNSDKPLDKSLDTPSKSHTEPDMDV